MLEIYNKHINVSPLFNISASEMYFLETGEISTDGKTKFLRFYLLGKGSKNIKMIKVEFSMEP